MRDRVYVAASVLAWPAAGWFAFESILRSATGDPSGAAIAAGWMVLAVAMIAVARIRRIARRS